MGACATKFSVLKNTSTAPPPDVKCEVEPGEVNLVEEVVVEKDEAPAVDDEATRRQSLGHLLQEVEEKKGSADSNCKESEDVNHVDAAEVKLEAVADAAAQVEREKAYLADGSKSKCAEEERPANQNVEMEAEKIEDKPAETLKLETTEKPEENKAAEIPCADKAPETLETEKTEVKKPALDEEIKVEEVKLAEKTPETPEAERSEEQCLALDAKKKETEEKSTEIMETPEKKPAEPEATKEQELASEAEKKNSEEKPCEISNEKPELPETEKAAEKVEDKHVLEPHTTETLLANKEPETCSVEEQKPVTDAEKPKAEEEKAK